MFDQRIYESTALFYLRWTARILSLASISLLFFFFVGEGFDPTRVDPKEWAGLLFFPLGLIIGLLIGWKNEGLGGIISTLSLLAFYFVYGFLLSGRIWQGWTFLVFAVPGFLFALYRLLVPGRFADFRHV